MKRAWVLRRKADGKFRKHYRKVPSYVRDTGDDWTDDLQAARTYTNKGGASNAIPYRADKAGYEFLAVKLVLDG